MNKRALPPLPALRAFDAAAKYLSFKKAADELCVTPSAISHHIQHLEDFLLTKLFNRYNRKLSLTDAGMLYWKKIKVSLDHIEEATRDIAELDEGELLTFSTPPMLMQSLLIPQLDSFLSDNPSVNLRFIDTLEHFDFQKNSIDAAIWYGHGEWKNIHSQLLFKEEACIVCSPKLLKKSSPLKSLVDLKHHTLIHTEKRLSHWKNIFKENELENTNSKRGLRFLHSNNALHAALEGLGIAIINRNFLQKHLDSGELIIPFNASFESTTTPGYYFVCPEGSLAIKKVELIYHWVSDVTEAINRSY
jgi:LysR family glycine cleavage system transcriptional activator